MNRLQFYLDLLERSVWTFVQTTGGTWIASSIVGTTALMDLAATDRLSIAAAAGVVAVVKGVIATQLPWTAQNSASVLPEELDPPAPVGP